MYVATHIDYQLGIYCSQWILHLLGKVSWQFMHGLMENAIYGGRVDNIYDMRVLQSYLVQLFDNKLLTGEVVNRTVQNFTLFYS